MHTAVKMLTVHKLRLHGYSARCPSACTDMRVRAMGTTRPLCNNLKFCYEDKVYLMIHLFTPCLLLFTDCATLANSEPFSSRLRVLAD